MNKWPLIASVIQLCIGVVAVATYVVVAVSGEPLGKWTITLILAIAFIILGIIGIVNWIKGKKRG